MLITIFSYVSIRYFVKKNLIINNTFIFLYSFKTIVEKNFTYINIKKAIPPLL